MTPICSLLLSVLCVPFIWTSGINSESNSPVWSNDNGTSASLAQSSLKFAWDGYRALEVPSGDNVFYSPYSIINALGMLTLGSQGQLETQLKEALRVPSSLTSAQLHQELSEENEKLSIEKEATIGVANRFFVDKDSVTNINPEYKTDLEKNYKSDLQATPFGDDPNQAQTAVNEFVSVNTDGEIPKLLDQSPDPQTLLMLVNAIYFKGLWTVPFKEQFTEEGPFHAKKGDITVHYMWSQSLLQYAQSPELKADMVVLPYTENKKYGFYAIVPKEGQTLESFEDSLDDKKIRQLVSQLNFRNVELKIPRFTMKSRFEQLKSTLKKLGAVGLDEPQNEANSKIFLKPIQRAFIDDIIHEAKVEVNENGTVAAAATSIGVVAISLPIYRPVTLNKPFLFFIADNSNGFILFWGRVEDPSSTK